jgi:hypothetical protein
MPSRDALTESVRSLWNVEDSVFSRSTRFVDLPIPPPEQRLTIVGLLASSQGLQQEEGAAQESQGKGGRAK